MCIVEEIWGNTNFTSKLEDPNIVPDSNERIERCNNDTSRDRCNPYSLSPAQDKKEEAEINDKNYLKNAKRQREKAKEIIEKKSLYKEYIQRNKNEPVNFITSLSSSRSISRDNKKNQTVIPSECHTAREKTQFYNTLVHVFIEIFINYRVNLMM